MAIWDPNVPGDDWSANEIHLAIQGVRTDIMDRMRCNNDDFDEHAVYGAGATGKHEISRVGFLGVHSTMASLLAMIAAGDAPDGSMHHVNEEGYAGIYVVVSGNAVRSLVSDHGGLVGLSDDDHTQYYLVNMSRAISGDMTINSAGALSVGSSGTADSDPLTNNHVGQSWLDGHGANALWKRHFANVPESSLYVITDYGINLSPSANGFSISWGAYADKSSVAAWGAGVNEVITGIYIDGVDPNMSYIRWDGEFKWIGRIACGYMPEVTARHDGRVHRIG